MNIHRGIPARLIYVAVRMLSLVFQAFPIDTNLKSARLIGKAWWRIDKRRRRRTLDHLRHALGDQYAEDGLNEIGRKSFEHLVMWFVELLCAFRMLNEWSWPRYIQPVDLQEPIKLLLEQKGAILITGHYGNFELTAFTLAAVGFDVVAVMRPVDNPYLNDFVKRTRASRGLKLLDKKNVAATAEEVLKSGGAIGFVADQDAGRKGLFVDFFNRKASTYKSIALLAMQCDVPILIGHARRIGHRFQYQAHINRIIRPDEWRNQPDPLRWITQEYTTAIEQFVREQPEQYLWIHRRWKSRPKSEMQPPGEKQTDNAKQTEPRASARADVITQSRPTH